MRRILITMTASLLALAACKPYDEIVQTWIGAPEDKLVSIWGPPTETLAAEKGVRVLIYTRDSANDLIIPSSGPTPGARADSGICETTFTLKDGRVVGYTHGGSGC